jgi:hypothetical protein
MNTIRSLSGICSLGGFPDASAAVLAGLSGIRPASDFELFFQGSDTPVEYPIGEAPIITHGCVGVGRLVALLHHAAADLAARNHDLPVARGPWFLALPDPIARRIRIDVEETDDDAKRASRLGAIVVQRTMDALGWRDRPDCTFFGGPRTGLAAALAAAGAALASGRARHCVVGALDSLVDRAMLDDLAADNLLRSPDNTYGISPAEGVALFVITKPGGSAGDGIGITAVAGQKASVDTKRGDGRALASTINAVLGDARGAVEPIILLSDQNGLLERDVEMGNAWFHLADLGLAERMSSRPPIAASLGEAGVAAPALASAVAVHALQRRRWPAQRGVVLISDDDAACATILLTRR